MNRDKFGRFTKKATTDNQMDKEAELERLIDEMHILEETMSELNEEIDFDQECFEKERTGDASALRAALEKQKLLIDLMLESLDVLEEIKEKKAKCTPKKECKCKKKKGVPPEEVFEILKPILDELGVSPEEIAQVGFLDVQEMPDGVCIKGSIDIEDKPPKWCRKKK